ncbi:creatininase family protein [Cohnella hongkongensis]|uniref:Creatininase family protein n=1 Tax=Cohnella hongkongensis TaxID=178337 RepID=A0ABV9FIF6_9BACL
MRRGTWHDFREKLTEATVAILPVGSIEQHGLHAPLGTDLYIAEGLAQSVDGVEHAMLLPSVPVGVAEYHRHFAGSLWVSPETLKRYVGEIVKSLAYHGVKKVIVVNGHGGNREPLKEMARYVMMDADIRVVVWTWFESIEPEIVRMYGRRPPLHADETETSMLMAIQPDYIQPDQYEASSRGAGEWGQFYEGTMISQTVKDFSPTGATGNPAKTDLAQGRRMLELSVDNLKRLIAYMSAL